MIKIIGTVLFIIMLIIIATSDDDYDKLNEKGRVNIILKGLMLSIFIILHAVLFVFLIFDYHDEKEMTIYFNTNYFLDLNNYIFITKY